MKTTLQKILNNPQIYQAMDSFLTEAKDQNGNDRSLERLNQDRHLFMERMKEIITQSIKDSLSAVEVEEREIGENTHCKTCKGHLAAGECDCRGWNYAIQDRQSKVDLFINS